MIPTFVAHPANQDAEEAFAIVFQGPKDGPVYGDDADKLFSTDARKIARLIAWNSTFLWGRVFADEFNKAFDEIHGEGNGPDAETLVDFIGEPIETTELTAFASIQLAS